MRDENRLQRQQQIAQAAYRVLEQKGYAATSMLAIARKARASNETLYNWYGDKAGLFKALVSGNAEQVRHDLTHHLAQRDDPLETLAHIGPVLLDLLLGARAVALNRAAAADPSGELGAVISQQGRETVAPLIGQVLTKARDLGQLSFDTVDDALELYLNLLVGDLQIRRVIGRMDQPTSDEHTQRAARALRHFMRLMGPDPKRVRAEPGAL